MQGLEVVCYFCGDGLLLVAAAVLTVRPSWDSGEPQQLFCHKAHLVAALLPSVVMHPDFFEE